MGYATSLGLDLGKFKSVCCVMNAATGEHAFETLASTPATIADLLTRCAAAAPDADEAAHTLGGHRTAGEQRDLDQRDSRHSTPASGPSRAPSTP